jgi:hypothetical protein
LVLLISVLLLLLRGYFDCNLRKIVGKGSAGKRESVKMNSSIETESGWRAGPRKQEEDHDGNEVEEEEEQQQQQQQEEEEEQEEELDSTILQVSLHPAPFVRIHKMSFPELCRTFRFLCTNDEMLSFPSLHTRSNGPFFLFCGAFFGRIFLHTDGSQFLDKTEILNAISL